MADLPDYYTQAQISEAEAAAFKGGLDANKSATPVSRDLYLATDTQILYVCVADGTWTGFDASILTQGILTLYQNLAGGGKQIKAIADPTAAQDAATRAYVLARVALRLALTGGTMSGNIAMGGNKLTGLGAPTAQNDSLRYGRAEIRVAEILATEFNVANKLVKLDGSALLPTAQLPVHGAAKHTDITRVLFLPANEGYAGVGTPVELSYFSTVRGLADSNQPYVYFSMPVPDDFVSFTKVEAVWFCAAASGNMYWRLRAKYGASGEAYSTHADEQATGVTATGGAWIINVQEAPNPLTLANLAVGDYLGILFNRDGSDASDTLNLVAYLVGLLFTYVANQ